MNAPRRTAPPIRRVQQLRLDLGGDDHAPGHRPRPRPIASGISAVLRDLLPDPSAAHQLVELTGPERRRLYDLAGLSPLHRAELEDAVRQAIRRRYRRAT